MRLLIFLAVFTAGYRLACAQPEVQNADIEQICDTSETGAAHWKCGGQSGRCGTDSVFVRRGSYSMHIANDTAHGEGFFYQDIPLRSEGLAKYRISCAVRVRSVKDQFAGVGARVVDADGNTIAGYAAFKVSGTCDWKAYEGEFFVDETAVSMRIFGQLLGSGEAWFDDIAIEEVPMNSGRIWPDVEKYIGEYFGLVREYSVVRDTSYIAELERRAKRLCAGNPDIDYCHSVLKRYVTLKLNDGHSFFLTPNEWWDLNNGNAIVEKGQVNFAGETMVEGNIAYISVPAFHCLDSALVRKYVDSMHKTIARLEARNPKGWIVDISDNAGGNSMAMVPGLGPLLGNGVCGYFLSATGEKKSRVYDNGRAGWDTDLEVATTTPYRLKNPDRPVAVIYGGATASAGEVVAIAFRGRKNAMSFGRKTSGATIRIDTLKMSDGAYLHLVAGCNADRNGEVFMRGIAPDVPAEDRDQAVVEAVRWIMAKAR